MLPAPTTVLNAIVVEARSGELFLQLGITLARVFVAFTLAMTVGSAIGLLMGRIGLVDRFGDSGSSSSSTCPRWSLSCSLTCGAG